MGQPETDEDGDMTGDELRAARGVLGEMWGYGTPLPMAELGRALRLQGRDPGATIRDWERGAYCHQRPGFGRHRGNACRVPPYIAHLVKNHRHPGRVFIQPSRLGIGLPLPFHIQKLANSAASRTANSGASTCNNLLMVNDPRDHQNRDQVKRGALEIPQVQRQPLPVFRHYSEPRANRR